MSLQIYRDQVDTIDKSLIGLLEKRILISSLIGKLKRKEGDLSKTLDRKEEIMCRVKKLTRKISNQNIEKIYIPIFDLSEKCQNKNKKKRVSKVWLLHNMNL